MFENRLCLGMRETAVFKYPGRMSQEANGTDAKIGYSLKDENVQIIKKKCV